MLPAEAFRPHLPTLREHVVWLEEHIEDALLEDAPPLPEVRDEPLPASNPKYLVAEYTETACFRVPSDMDHERGYTIKWGVLRYRSTDGKDKEVLLKLQAVVATTVLGTVQEMSFARLGWGDSDMALLAMALMVITSTIGVSTVYARVPTTALQFGRCQHLEIKLANDLLVLTLIHLAANS